VAEGVRTVRSTRPHMGLLLVTHYVKLLDELNPDVVSVLIDGHVVATGGADIAQIIERDGYESFRSTVSS
jgi:Fe-S cluster assembly ATP-binding protein